MVKYGELLRVLKKEGWIVIRQKGSHIVFRHPEKDRQITLPYHEGKEVKTGLLRAILKQTGIKFRKR